MTYHVTVGAGEAYYQVDDLADFQFNYTGYSSGNINNVLLLITGLDKLAIL